MLMTKVNSILSSLSVVTLFLSLSSVTAGQSLSEAVAIALDQYPAILAAQARAQAADADIQRAQGAHYPQVSWQGTQSNYNTTGISNAWVQSPVVNFNIWAGGKIEAEVDRTRALAEVNVQQQRITRDEVVLLLIEGYLNWARGLELVKLATTNVEAHDKILKNITQIVQLDQGRRIDQEQAKVRYDNATLSLQQRQAELAIARERLSRMLQGKTPAIPTGIESLQGKMPLNIDQALLDLNDMHPAIAQQLSQISAAKASISGAQSQHMPTVNLSYGKQVNQGTAQNDYVTQLTVSIPIFSGGSADAAVKQAVFQLQAAEHSLTELRLTLREKLLASWAEWVSAKSRSQLGLQQVKTGESLVDGYFKQFQVGRRSLLDLLNIQADSYNYQTNALIASFDERIARSRVQSAMGKLAAAYAYSASHKTGTTNYSIAKSDAALPVQDSKAIAVVNRSADRLLPDESPLSATTDTEVRRKVQEPQAEANRSSDVPRESVSVTASSKTTPLGSSGGFQIPAPASAVVSTASRADDTSQTSPLNARLSKNYFGTQLNSGFNGMGSQR